MEKIHILHVIDALDYAGAQRLLVTLAKYTPVDRYRVTVFCLQPKTALSARIEACGVRAVCLNMPRPSILAPHKLIRYALQSVREIARFCRREKVQVIQCHLSDAEFIGIAAGTLAGVQRIIPMNHYPFLPSGRSKLDLRNLIRKISCKLMYNVLSYRVIAVSPDTADRLANDFGVSREKIRVIVNGIDLDLYGQSPPQHDLRRNLGVAPEDRVLLAVGRLTHQKGHVYLIDAVAKLSADFPKIKLLIAGEGELREYLVSRSKQLGVRNNIIFLGNRSDVSALLSLSELFVMPSIWEGASLALLEAMASAKAILATGEPGNANIIRHLDNGYLVRPGSADALAQGISFLLDHPDVAVELGRNAREAAEKGYDARRMTAEMEPLWLGLDDCGKEPGRFRRRPAQAATGRLPRVAVTGLRGTPASFGGVEKQCEHLYSRLAARGFPITIYARKGYVPDGTSFYRGIKVRILPTINTKHTEAFFHTFLCVLDILKTDCEIAHIYGQGPSLFAPLLRLFKRGTKIFFTCGGLDWQRKKWNPAASFIIHLGEVCSAYFTDYRVTVSAELKKYYESRYGVAAHYIPNGMPEPVKRSLDAVQIPGIAPRGYFLFVGRLVPEKRIEDIIAAYMEKPRACALAIVGDSAGTPDYVRTLKELAGDRNGVCFLGYRYGAELEALYSNARAFINASELEGLPLTVLEAISYSLVCLTSDIPPHREIARLTGDENRMFPPGDTKALSGLMDRVEALEAEELTAMGDRFARAVSGHYSWDLAAEELEKLYLQSAEALRAGQNQRGGGYA